MVPARQQFVWLAAAVLAAAILGAGLWAGTAFAHHEQPPNPAPAEPYRMMGHGMMGHALMGHGMMGHGMGGHGMMGRGMRGPALLQSTPMTATNLVTAGIPESTLPAQDSVQDSVQDSGVNDFVALVAAADPARGQRLTVAGGCIGCHSLDENPALVGPTWEKVGETAATRVAGQDAVTYLYNSIVDPNAYVVPGYQPNIMPHSYGQMFGAGDLAAIVKYLLAQES